MKKIILVIGLAVVLTACGNKDEKETIIVEEKLQNMSSSDNLDIESNNIIEEQKDIENNEEPIIENIEEALLNVVEVSKQCGERKQYHRNRNKYRSKRTER